MKTLLTMLFMYSLLLKYWASNFETRFEILTYKYSLSKIWNIFSEGKTKCEQDGSRDEGGGEKVGMVNEVECWQRIISMTSKGVVISRCFSPSLPRTASGEPPPRDCINSSLPLRPGFPFTPHSPFCSASSSRLTHPLLGPRVDVIPPEAQLPGTNEACRRRV